MCVQRLVCPTNAAFCRQSYELPPADECIQGEEDTPLVSAVEELILPAATPDLVVDYYVDDYGVADGDVAPMEPMP